MGLLLASWALALAAPAPQAAPPPPRDVVRTLDGRRLEGRATEFDRLVEVEFPDGRRQRLPRHEVLRIEPAVDFPRSPEVIPLPPGLLDKAGYSWTSWRRLLLGLPKDRAQAVVAFDPGAARLLWELKIPGLATDPVLAGPLLYTVGLEREPDSSRKMKVDGKSVPRDLHRLTVRVIDVLSGKVRHEFALDNRGKQDVYWTYAEHPAPTFHFLPERVVLKTCKDGWPLDAAGNVDKTKPRHYTSFTPFDPQAKTVAPTLDSPDAAEAGGMAHFTGDLAVLQIFLGTSGWKLVGLGAKDGKLRWESETFGGRLHEFTDEAAWISDPARFFAVSLKTGKPLEKGAVELDGGAIAEVAGGLAFLYRSVRAPREIRAIDLRKGGDAWRIPMPVGDDYAHLRLVGPRLLFTDHLNRIHAFDLAERKESWIWQGAGPSFLQGPSVLGGALAFYKDGRITLLDLATGRAVWDVRGSWRSLLPVEDEGFVAFRGTGADLVRGRRLDRPGVFLTPQGTPLRYAYGGEHDWSPPAVVGDDAYVLSSGGIVVGIRLKDRSVAWSMRASRTPIPALSAPVADGDVVAVNLGTETQFWAASNRGLLYKTRHAPGGIDRQFERAGLAWFACGSGVPFSAVEFASGRKLWDSPARSVLRCVAAGDAVHALSGTHYHRIDPADGAVRESLPLPRGVGLLAADASRVVLAAGPFAVGTLPGPGDLRVLWKSKNQDPKLAAKFKGHLALAPGGLLYSHADGGLVFVDDAGKEVWNVPAPGFTSAPLVHGGRAWVAAGGAGLLGIELQDGRVAWKAEVSDAADFVPILWEGKPAFWSLEGWVLPASDP